MSLSEVEKQIRIGDVDWITHNRQFMGKVELMIYKAYLITKDQMEVQGSPSNVNIATKINETLDTEHQLSRDAICQVRKKIACVMGFKSGW